MDNRFKHLDHVPLLDGKDTALNRLDEQFRLRKGSHIQYKIALYDGCEALQTRIAKHFPDFILILDFIHANEYLWKVTNTLFCKTNDLRFERMKKHTLLLLSGQTSQLITEFRSLATQPKISKHKRIQLIKTANYFECNLTFIDYPIYLSNGWPIASGVINGACRLFCERSLRIIRNALVTNCRKEPLAPARRR
ncbi:MAG: hypothetical protein JXA13_07175 [Anaerolineales bacterium]|nr:hypothetical protein [Anaerolineales bacterium]